MIRRLETKSHLEQVIEKGADVTSDKKIDKENWVIFSLRIRTDLLEKIDNRLHNRLGMKKTSWILEAIQEKLKREDENHS